MSFDSDHTYFLKKLYLLQLVNEYLQLVKEPIIVPIINNNIAITPPNFFEFGHTYQTLAQ